MHAVLTADVPAIAADRAVVPAVSTGQRAAKTGPASPACGRANGVMPADGQGDTVNWARPGGAGIDYSRRRHWWRERDCETARGRTPGRRRSRGLRRDRRPVVALRRGRRWPLIVLLHGFPESWSGSRLQIKPPAAAGFRVVAPDLRGYNLSSKPDACGLRHRPAGRLTLPPWLSGVRYYRGRRPPVGSLDFPCHGPLPTRWWLWIRVGESAQGRCVRTRFGRVRLGALPAVVGRGSRAG
jgi:alpha/beta hydrolase family protein